MIKGVEALLVESMLAARDYGVEDEVIASLSNLFPGVDWATHARYMISRAVEHGARRAEEMHEAARTVADAGLSPRMSEACAVTQAWTARQFAGADTPDLATLLDAMREKL
jgi:3-hydroxyisobutyrate dehydrogenase-like beta-hydroxyacid dehydrogenase